MPVSTRQTPAAVRSAKPTQQTRLNFGARKPNAVSAKDIASSKLPGATVVVHSSIRPTELDEKVEKKELEPVEDNDDDAGNDDDPLAQQDKLFNKLEEENEGLIDEALKVEEIGEIATETELEVLPFQEEAIERPAINASISGNESVEKALQVTDAQIKAYYKEIQDSQIAKNVHQEGLAEYEKVLRHFDHSSYGPCIGITRLKRWNRAHRFKQNPPIEVLAILLKSELGEDMQPALSKSWEPASTAEREGVGAMANVNELLATHAE